MGCHVLLDVKLHCLPAVSVPRLSCCDEVVWGYPPPFTGMQ